MGFTDFYRLAEIYIWAAVAVIIIAGLIAALVYCYFHHDPVPPRPDERKRGKHE